MEVRNNQISSLVEDQLPGFIVSEYENFEKTVRSYYEHQEIQGNPLDIINNIVSYRDINFYDKKILQKSSKLVSNINQSTTVITVEDATSFPEFGGYIKIDDEICFYKTRNNTTFFDVVRGISGNTRLGDLYFESEFVSTQSASHLQGSSVLNISNLFLYAFIKSFESQYLSSFPEEYLKDDVDKRILIKNIADFYRSKGTEKSIQFIFNSIVSKSSDDVPETYNPKDYTLKASTSTWISDFTLRVKIVSGDPISLIGQKLIQGENIYDASVQFASAIIDNINFVGEKDGEALYDLILQKESINGDFKIVSKTKLVSPLLSSKQSGDRIDVYSTFGWHNAGALSIKNEIITFAEKTVNQFIIKERGTLAQSYQAGETVYEYSNVYSQTDSGKVQVIVTGILFNLIPKNSNPYSNINDPILKMGPGFETRNPIIFDEKTSGIRWKINETGGKANSLNTALNPTLNKFISGVSAIYEDSEFYYICASGYPTFSFFASSIFSNLPPNQRLYDPKHLKLIKKVPETTTEVSKTPERDVGIFVDGSLAYSYKDEEFVSFGKITNINVTNKGSGYRRPPFVLVNNQKGKALASLSGDVLESVKITTDEIFQTIPTITVTSGRNAKISAVVTSGKVTSLKIDDPGEFYSSPPVIRITDRVGRGRFAEYTAVISNEGKIVDTIQIDEGKFYTKENILVEIIPDGVSNPAKAEAEIFKWYFNRYAKVSQHVDLNNGFIFKSFNDPNLFSYGVVANPRVLRLSLNDNLLSTGAETPIKTHSPILGYAYDGNPIYGPFGYQDPFNSTSPIARMNSGYSLKSSRTNGPAISEYPLGTFIDDYKWTPNVNLGKTLLDKNNGRFCITPDYPDGVYAYFITADGNNTPKFPYILGENFYSLPVKVNYEEPISQDQLPKDCLRLKTPLSQINGVEDKSIISNVSSGDVDSAIVDFSTDIFGVGSRLIVDNSNTNGFGASGVVSSVTGKDVLKIESKQTKAIQINTVNNCYLFAGDTITQEQTNATGQVLGNVFDENRIFIRNVVGNFNTTNKLNSSTVVLTLLLNSNSSYTDNSTLSLLDKDDNVIASGVVLGRTIAQNSVRVRVTSGTFVINESLILKSSSLIDTVGSSILSISNLSRSLDVSSINDSIAIAFTDVPHKLKESDIVDIDIDPNNNLTSTTIFVRKKLYQELTLLPPSFNATINDSGIGRFDVLNAGIDYQTGSYTNVELIFANSSTSRKEVGIAGNPNNARATIVVNNVGGGYGKVTSITITSKGSGYKSGDILTVSSNSLNRLGSSNSTSRLLVKVDHAGFSLQNTVLKLSDVSGLSNNDLLKISNEVLRITSINQTNKTLVVQRGVNNTIPTDYPDKFAVKYSSPEYKFTIGSKIFGNTVNDPEIFSYDKTTQKLIVSYDYESQNPRSIVLSSSFLDNSTPRKVVSIESLDPRKFKLQFIKNNISSVNPIIEIQKYYEYIFDTSHFSLLGTYFDFSTSRNNNIYFGQKEVSSINPGNPGAFVKLKAGFTIGDNGDQNFVKQKTKLQFTNLYYFTFSPDIDTDESFLKIIDDPLSGLNQVIYSTDNTFVYNIKNIPQFDGTGDISYTTTSQTAVGKINSVLIDNLGQDYEFIPLVDGVIPAPDNECIVDCKYDSITKQLLSVDIISPGSGYSKPKVIVFDGDGSGAEFSVFQNNGKIVRIDVTNKGSNYTFKPNLKVIETNNKIFFESKNIGRPESVSFIDNGYSFNSDFSYISKYTSPYILLLENFDKDSFYPGEKVVQKSAGNIVASGIVSKNGWRIGSNILKLERIEGVFKENSNIVGTARNKTARVKKIFFTEFDPSVKSQTKYIGRFNSDQGKIGSNAQRILDSNFYQDYSYVIKSKTPINNWRNIIKQTTHPAGFKLFGELSVDSSASSRMPEQSAPTESTTIVLSVPPVSISSLTTTRLITTSVFKVSDLNIRRGKGSVSVDSFDDSQTRVKEIILTPAFNGVFNNSTGQKIGRTTFTILDKITKTPYTPFNTQELFITLDGIAQEPGISYQLNGNQIIFSEPPLGSYIEEGQQTNAQQFYGRSFKFRDNSLNAQYLKKLKDISINFNGVDKQFDLFYENNGIVKTTENENLLIFLNGILQKDYTIKRFKTPSKTDRIIFPTAPTNHADLLDNPPKELKGNDKFFGYNVGSYERLTVDKRIIPFLPSGPFLILDKFTDKVRKIDNPLYAYVFVEGVLQKNEDSYTINGSNITFNDPLTVSQSPSGEYTYPSVEILYFYGRDLQKTLSFYNFEDDTYFNTADILLEGPAVYSLFLNWSEKYTSIPNYIYKIDEVTGKNQMIGKIISAKKNTNSSFRIKAQTNNNIILKDTDFIGFTTNPGIENGDNLLLETLANVELTYESNDLAERILTRKESTYSSHSSYESVFNTFNYKGIIFKHGANLIPGDMIQIDGEFDKREIKSLPLYAKTTQYNELEQVSNNNYGRVASSEYNGDVYGEGLSVTASIEFGKISKLSWNRRDLNLFFNNNLLLQPTAYQYFTPPILNFIPVDGKGGGAKAEVLVYDGQIIDIILIDGGKGYTKPPKVVVSRGYDVINNRSKLDTVATLTISPLLSASLSLEVFSDVKLFGDAFYEFFVDFSSPTDTTTKVIKTIYCEDQLVTLQNSTYSLSKIICPQVNIDSITSVSFKTNTSYILELPSVSFISSSSQLEKSRTTGAIDYISHPVNNPQIYSLDKLGSSVGSFVENLFNDSGAANVSGLSIEMLDLYYDFGSIQEYENNRFNKSSTTTYGQYINSGIPSIQEYGSFLDSSISESDTIIYVPDTTKFASSGKLLIGKEIVSYTSKLPDRFTGVARGVDGTEAVSHNAGDYLRTLGNTV